MREQLYLFTQSDLESLARLFGTLGQVLAAIARRRGIRDAPDDDDIKSWDDEFHAQADAILTEAQLALKKRTHR